MRENTDPSRVLLRSNSMLNLARAVESGVGAALLPSFLGRMLTGVQECALDQPLGERAGLWVLTHPDLRRAARIRLATAFFYEQLKKLEPSES